MTLTEEYQKILNDYAQQFGVNPGELGPTVQADSQVLSAALYLLKLYLGEAVKEVWPDTCSEEMLLRFGILKPGRLPFQPTAGVYTVTYTGGALNQIIPAGTVFKQNDGEGQYVLDINWVVDGDTGTFQVRALEAGFATALNLNSAITATNPLAAIDDEVTVSEITAAPLSGEDIEDYRQLVLEEYRREPQGGSIGDYRSWARDAQGVRRVYPYLPNPYEGIINIYVEATVADSDPNGNPGEPTAAILEEVEEVLIMDPDITKSDEKRMRLPLDVKGVNVVPVNTIDVIVNITNISDNSSVTKDSIVADIESYLFEKRPYQGGVDGKDANNIIRLNDIERIILNYVSNYDDCEMLIKSVSESQYTIGDATNPAKHGEIPYLANVNYV